MLCAFAGPVSQETAMQTAQKFLNKRGGKKAAPLKSVTPKTRLLKSAAAGSNAPYYIFNVGNAAGFVIVSGEDTAIPVLGYAEEYVQNGYAGAFSAWAVRPVIEYSLDNLQKNESFAMTSEFTLAD